MRQRSIEKRIAHARVGTSRHHFDVRAARNLREPRQPAQGCDLTIVPVNLSLAELYASIEATIAALDGAKMASIA